MIWALRIKCMETKDFTGIARNHPTPSLRESRETEDSIVNGGVRMWKMETEKEIVGRESKS
jgi:hypothetical protein